MKRFPVVALACVALLLAQPVWTEEKQENPELAKAVNEAKLSLQQGLSASAREGKAISGKFEMEDGKLQLSVYTMKAGKFSEVIVDHQTGKIVKVEPITGGEDLTAAQGQSQAMGNARQTLGAAIARAVRANQGFRAVSAVPELKDGHAIAEVTLVKDGEWRRVSEKLD